MAEAWALWYAFTAAAAVLGYLAASCVFPLQDAKMEQLDRAIGFDWSLWHDAVLRRPILSFLLSVAYASLLPQTILSIIYFPATDRSARTQELLLLAGATMVATVTISAIWPTLGPFSTHIGSDAAYLRWVQEARDLLALRAGGRGISSFRRCKPS
jgi:PAP2 superfamily